MKPPPPTDADYIEAAALRMAWLAATCIDEVEGVYDLHQSTQAAQLLVAARVFAGAVDVFLEWHKRDGK